MTNPVRTCPSTNFIKHRKSPGFTLIETVAVVGLSLLVMTIVCLALYYGARSSAHARVGIVNKQDILKQFHRIRFQLLNLYLPASGGEVLTGEEGAQEDRSEIYFVTSSLVNNRTIGEAGYKIMQDYNGDTYLAYSEFPYPRDIRFALKNENDKWIPISAVVKGMSIEYLQNGLWFKEWKKDDPPSKIKITLWYKESEEDQELTPYSFIVIPGISSVF